MCELSLEKMGAIFADTNVYMLHMMYQAMGVCLYMQDWDGAMSYGEKIIQPYRYVDLLGMCREAVRTACKINQSVVQRYYYQIIPVWSLIINTCRKVCIQISLVFRLMYKWNSLHSVHYPAYSLNVASMYLKLGRLYLGLEKKTQGVKALKKVCLQISAPCVY